MSWRPCLVLGAALIAGPACNEPAARSVAPDVLLVVLDTVRADHLSPYGYARPTAPHLADLAARGVLFEDVTAPSNWTWPTHASLFTGTAPWVHGAHFGRGQAAVHFDWGGFARGMRQDLPTLAEGFAAAGYRSVLVTANPLLRSPTADSITRGFAEKWDVETDRRALEQARAVLLSRDPRPLFLFVNLYGAHNPYELRAVPWLTPERLEAAWLEPLLAPGGRAVDLQRRSGPEGRSISLQVASGDLKLPAQAVSLLRDLYDGELVEVDAVLGELLSAWRQRSLRDSIVAVTSDHGEYLGEHGLVEHTYLLYTQVVRVPLVLSAPGRLPEGVRVETPVQLQDLYATLLDLALGRESQASLRSLVLGREPGAAPVRSIAYPRTGIDVEKLRFLYRYYREADDVVLLRSDGAVELYDLGRDPAMNDDLFAAQRGRAEALASRAGTAFAVESEAPTPPVPIPAEDRDRLRQLGYIE